MVWGLLYVLISNNLVERLRRINDFLKFCILTPLFDTTLFFTVCFIGFLAVSLLKNGQ